MCCAGLGLLIVMLLARKAGGHSPGPGASPTEMSPFRVRVVAGLAFVVLILIARGTSSATLRQL